MLLVSGRWIKQRSNGRASKVAIYSDPISLFSVLAPDLGSISRAASRGERKLHHTHSAKVLKYNREIVNVHLLGPVHPLQGPPARDAVKMNEMLLQLTAKLY